MKKYTDEQKEKAVKLKKEGFLLREICEMTGITNKTTVTNLCIKAGMKSKPYHRKDYEIGQRHEFYVIIKPTKSIMTEVGNHYTRWECLCDCGTTFEITTKQINRGQKSCGCHKFDSRFRRSLTDEEANIRRLLGQYKRGAELRELPWELTEKEATKLFLSNCRYCNSVPNRIEDRLKHCEPILVSGIDRVDNNKGYTSENCVSCCRICNRAKLNATVEEFEKWAKNFIENFKGI